MSKKIKLIVGSTREGRVGGTIADWLVSQARGADVDIEVLDLANINLPFFTAPVPPMYAPVETEEAKAWADMVADADGIIFLTPEYNRGYPAPLKNAIDYLYKEWNGMPAMVASYGYIDGGKNASTHLLDVLNWVKMKIVGEELHIGLKADDFDGGTFKDIDATLVPVKESFLRSLKELHDSER